ncbi:hypothetical protein ACJIZ3_007369 [Penstemon smallii]|uniref:Uncharacterized protein n=1 Tax=Penstemon smallii TaxID=265156 RepID=A0ABD3SAC0_9LAMI
MNYEKFRCSEDQGMIFGYLEDDDDSFGLSSYESSIDKLDSTNNEVLVSEEDDDENSSININADKLKAFWETQEVLLQTTLSRTTTFETKVRHALRKLNAIVINCSCRKSVANSCRSCRQKEICSSLQSKGFNCVICKSEWKSSPQIPAGEHTYLEVVQTSGSKKGEVKVIIELNFRAEFQVARACDEYNELIKRLPESFVGKTERLKNLIKILCCASKKCIKERKMHLAPWRKHKYMQAKWQGSPSIHAAEQPIIAPTSTEPPILMLKPRASMLTFDFADYMRYCKATKVM